MKQQEARAQWTDIISDFLDYTDFVLSPELFRKWAGIALVAGALERRVWLRNGPRVVFPNLYCLLVAPPGVGKQVISEVRDLWREAHEPGTSLPAFAVGPNSLTKASLVDRLKKSSRRPPLWAKDQSEFHSLLIASEEFGTLMPAYDLEYIATLNDIFNCPSEYSEERRYGKAQEIKIVRPQLHIFGGTQPGWLASVFPEEAWTMGLTSRMMMIYQSVGEMKNLFYMPPEMEAQRATLVARLGTLSQMWGEYEMTSEAQQMVMDWYMGGAAPAPTHSKLQNYLARRPMQVMKLSLVSAISREGSQSARLVTSFDVQRAFAWLFEAESLMPDIFRAMIGKSDSQVLEELHFMMTNAYVAAGRKPLSERLLYSFLIQRVPSDKIERLIQMADRANIIAQVAGTNTFIPRPKHEHGVE